MEYNYSSNLGGNFERLKRFSVLFAVLDSFSIFLVLIIVIHLIFTAMPLLTLGPIIFGPILGLIQYLQSYGLLPDPKACPVCSTTWANVNMVLEQRNDVRDKYRWRCTACQKRISLRDGTFFSKSRLPL